MYSRLPLVDILSYEDFVNLESVIQNSGKGVAIYRSI